MTYKSFDHLHPAIGKIESLVRLEVTRISLHEDLGQLENLEFLNAVGMTTAEEHFELTKLETIGLAGFDWDNEDESFDHWSDMKDLHTFQMSEMALKSFHCLYRLYDLKVSQYARQCHYRLSVDEQSNKVKGRTTKQADDASRLGWSIPKSTTLTWMAMISARRD